MTYLLIFLNISAVLLFLFLYWKRLRSDYTEEQVFGSELTILLTTIALVAISYFLDFNYWFWFATFGVLLGLYLSKKKLALGLIENLEATFVAFLPWLSIIYLYDFAMMRNIISISLLAITILVAVAFFLIDKNYKKIAWYKSGKIGIAGLISVTLFFTLRLLIGIAAPTMLSFLGNYDIMLSVIAIASGIIATIRLAKLKT